MKGFDEFGLIFTSELILAIMSDGKWYSTTTLRRRIRPSTRGVITGTLSRLRRYEFVIRAKNPLDKGRPFHRQLESQYLYQWTGKPAEFTRQPRWRQFKQYLKVKDVLPWYWRDILK